MSLSRILETEYMDTPAEADDYNAMDHSTVNALFVTDLLAAGPDGDLLDLGTGTALIPVELCKRWEEGRVMAVDAAVSMLNLARYNVEAGGFPERIQLRHLDAKDLPFDDGYFRGVISNSIVHHIPEPRQVLREAVRVTAPDGLLFFRDLVRPESESELRRLVELYAGRENAHSQQMFADSLHAALTLDEIRGLVSELGFPPESVQLTSDRHWTWNARRGTR